MHDDSARNFWETNLHCDVGHHPVSVCVQCLGHPEHNASLLFLLNSSSSSSTSSSLLTIHSPRVFSFLRHHSRAEHTFTLTWRVGLRPRGGGKAVVMLAGVAVSSSFSPRRVTSVGEGGVGSVASTSSGNSGGPAFSGTTGLAASLPTSCSASGTVRLVSERWVVGGGAHRRIHHLNSLGTLCRHVGFPQRADVYGC